MKQILLIIAVVALVGCGGGETKTCIYCKEPDIQYLAEICKHCGKDPDGPNGSEMRLESYKEEAGQGGRAKRNEHQTIFGWDKRTAFWSLILIVIPTTIAVCWYVKDLRARRKKEDEDVD